MTEHELQTLILEFLTVKRKGYFWRQNTGAVCSEYKGKSRFIQYGKSGCADILGVLAGRFIAIEVKGPKGRQNDNQKAFQSEVERAGGIYYLANDFEKFEQWYRDLTTNQE